MVKVIVTLIILAIVPAAGDYTTIVTENNRQIQSSAYRTQNSSLQRRVDSLESRMREAEADILTLKKFVRELIKK